MKEYHRCHSGAGRDPAFMMPAVLIMMLSASNARGGQCRLCPDGKWSKPGSTACAECDANKEHYCKDGVRTKCGDNSHTATATASSVSECICDAGYYGSSGVCTRCPNSGTSPAGTTASSGCTAPAPAPEPCLDGRWRPTGSTTCEQCDTSYRYYCKGGVRTQCGANSKTYMSTSSSTLTATASEVSQCRCDANYYGSSGVCTGCPANSTTLGQIGKTSSSECKCNAGYYGSNGTCTPCSSKQYQNLTGQSSCKDCIPGACHGTANTKMAGKCEINKILTLAEAKECLGSTPAGTWTVVGKYVIPAIAENKLPPPDPLPAGVYATKNWWNNHTNSTNAVFVVPGNIPAYYWFEDCSSWCSSKLQFGSNSSIRFDDETIGGITTTGRPKLVPNQASISTFNTGSKGMWLYKYTF